jgi:hypothetical protein
MWSREETDFAATLEKHAFSVQAYVIPKWFVLLQVLSAFFHVYFAELSFPFSGGLCLLSARRLTESELN